MKYLIRYRVFESLENIDEESIEQDIKDCCQIFLDDYGLDINFEWGYYNKEKKAFNSDIDIKLASLLTIPYKDEFTKNGKVTSGFSTKEQKDSIVKFFQEVEESVRYVEVVFNKVFGSDSLNIYNKKMEVEYPEMLEFVKNNLSYNHKIELSDYGNMNPEIMALRFQIIFLEHHYEALN
jgi:hypothetical protein